MTSSMIDIASTDGNSFQGYLSLPPTGTGPGIVLIQEIFGVNSHIRAVADQYALDGYVVLAPDHAASGVIYFSYSEPRGASGNGTAVARARLVQVSVAVGRPRHVEGVQEQVVRPRVPTAHGVRPCGFGGRVQLWTAANACISASSHRLSHPPGSTIPARAG